MGLRKRPYNEDKKSGKGGDSKKTFRATPAKRSAKPTGSSPRDEGRFNKRRDDNSDSGTRRSTGFKRGGDDSFRGKSRFSNDNGEGKAPAKRRTGFGSGEDRSNRKASGFNAESFDKKTPAKRTSGGFKRNDNEGRKPAVRRSGSFDRGEDRTERRPGKPEGRGYQKRTPAKTGGFNTRSKRYGESDWGEQEQKPRTSKSGKPYMVKGAKARDIKAKSEEKMELLMPDDIRLNRYISNSGICSRREADDLIAAGLVAVNGKIVTEMGFKVKPGDEVRYNNERLSWEKKVYLLMNKPKDSITTSDDPEGRKIIMDLIKDPRLPRVYPVGRLDRNTTGVILLTNDGELAQRLTHPKYNITKVYKATLNKNFTAKDLQELANNGVELEDGPIKPDVVGIPSASEKDVVMVQIHSGRNRIIHRMFEAMGYLVDKLDRIDFAGLERKGLDRGEWRHLDDKEIKKLKKLVQLK
jgi:23S rRNA pseudouridine2605 synthase